MSGYKEGQPVRSSGFTLIELSIVLVIIGLIVAGVVVGKDLITAAEVRSQMSQIESYQQAVNVFRGKYGYLPGDIPDPDASRFGFSARGSLMGQGDGDGVLMGTDGASAYGYSGVGSGEQLMFWVDLAQAKLIKDSFLPTASATAPYPNGITGTAIASYLPRAKLSNNAYVLAWAETDKGNDEYNCSNYQLCERNYFAVQNITVLDYGGVATPARFAVAQAYHFDKKADDGLPLAGAVRALTFDIDDDGGYRVMPSMDGLYHAGGWGVLGRAASEQTCMDNGGVAGGTDQYSMTWKNGSRPTCHLSIRMQ